MSTRPHAARSSTHPTSNGARKKVLIVEDDVGAARLIGRALDRDYAVQLAHDGAAGLALALSTPDLALLVTDITMPVLDGISMVQRIRASGAQKFPVIFLTAQSDPGQIAAAISAGARAYITKPVDLESFERRVRDALRTM